MGLTLRVAAVTGTLLLLTAVYGGTASGTPTVTSVSTSGTGWMYDDFTSGRAELTKESSPQQPPPLPDQQQLLLLRALALCAPE